MHNSPYQIFPGFVLDYTGRNHNLLFTDQYIFSPTFTNEFRFSYGRQDNEARISPQSIPEARTLPQITIGFNAGNISTISAPGIAWNLLQGEQVNNLLFQETQTKLSGRHTFRYGVEFLGQLASQLPAANSQGWLTYQDAPGYSAFANFLDDFSGPSGRWTRVFGATEFHPDQFRQTYFFQDTLLPTPSLSLVLGLRYENFGQPANALRFPAFGGFDPNDFLKPNHVNTDNKDFGPAFGLAWSPSFRSGWLRKLFGENKMVWRGGYQISYDAPFTQMVSLSMATSPPNAVSGGKTAPPTGRGCRIGLRNCPWGGTLPVCWITKLVS